MVGAKKIERNSEDWRVPELREERILGIKELLVVAKVSEKLEG